MRYPHCSRNHREAASAEVSIDQLITALSLELTTPGIKQAEQALLNLGSQAKLAGQLQLI